MQEPSQYNSKIEYRPGKEGGKPDTLMRREGDLPTAGNNRLTRNDGILLSEERYWDMPDTEEIKLDILETTQFPHKDEGEIQKANKTDNEIQAIKRQLDKGEKEMKGIALGYVNGRTTSYRTKERFRYQTTKGYGRLFSPNTTTSHKEDTAEWQKLPHSSAEYSIPQR